MKAVILRNHGLLTAGETVDEALWWFITMDRCCQSQLLAEAAGEPVRIAHDNALLARAQVGSHLAGWLQFQPLWDWITRLEPDLLD
jgi:ribulose-5-phosphate 4-epimerase/fuculose-1-phosphate aldolase